MTQFFALFFILILLVQPVVIAQDGAAADDEEEEPEDDGLTPEAFRALSDPGPSELSMCPTCGEAEFDLLDTSERAGFLQSDYREQFADHFYSDPGHIGVNEQVERNYFSRSGNIVESLDSAQRFLQLRYDQRYSIQTNPVPRGLSYNAQTDSFRSGSATLSLRNLAQPARVIRIIAVQGGFRFVTRDGEEEEDDEEDEETIDFTSETDTTITYDEENSLFQASDSDGEPQARFTTGDTDARITIDDEGLMTVRGDARGYYNSDGEMIEFQNRQGVLRMWSDGRVRADDAEINTRTMYLDGRFTREENDVVSYSFNRADESEMVHTVVVDKATAMGSVSQGQVRRSGCSGIPTVHPPGGCGGVVTHLQQRFDGSAYGDREPSETGDAAQTLQPPISDQEARDRARQLRIQRPDVGENGEVWIAGTRGGEVSVYARGRVGVQSFTVRGNNVQHVDLGRPRYEGHNGRAVFDYSATGDRDRFQIMGEGRFDDRQIHLDTERDGTFVQRLMNRGENTETYEVDCDNCEDGQRAAVLTKRLLIVQERDVRVRGTGQREALTIGEQYDEDVLTERLEWQGGLRLEYVQDGDTLRTTIPTSNLQQIAAYTRAEGATIAFDRDFFVRTGSGDEWFGISSEGIGAYESTSESDGFTPRSVTMDLTIRSTIGDIIVPTSDEEIESVRQFLSALGSREWAGEGEYQRGYRQLRNIGGITDERVIAALSRETGINLEYLQRDDSVGEEYTRRIVSALQMAAAGRSRTAFTERPESVEDLQGNAQFYRRQQQTMQSQIYLMQAQRVIAEQEGEDTTTIDRNIRQLRRRATQLRGVRESTEQQVQSVEEARRDTTAYGDDLNEADQQRLIEADEIRTRQEEARQQIRGIPMFIAELRYLYIEGGGAEWYESTSNYIKGQAPNAQRRIRELQHRITELSNQLVLNDQRLATLGQESDSQVMRARILMAGGRHDLAGEAMNTIDDLQTRMTLQMMSRIDQGDTRGIRYDPITGRVYSTQHIAILRTTGDETETIVVSDVNQLTEEQMGRLQEFRESDISESYMVSDPAMVRVISGRLREETERLLVEDYNRARRTDRNVRSRVGEAQEGRTGFWYNLGNFATCSVGWCFGGVEARNERAAIRDSGDRRAGTAMMLTLFRQGDCGGQPCTIRDIRNMDTTQALQQLADIISPRSQAGGEIGRAIRSGISDDYGDRFYSRLTMGRGSAGFRMAANAESGRFLSDQRVQENQAQMLVDEADMITAIHLDPSYQEHVYRQIARDYAGTNAAEFANDQLVQMALNRRIQFAGYGPTLDFRVDSRIAGSFAMEMAADPTNFIPFGLIAHGVVSATRLSTAAIHANQFIALTGRMAEASADLVQANRALRAARAVGVAEHIVVAEARVTQISQQIRRGSNLVQVGGTLLHGAREVGQAGRMIVRPVTEATEWLGRANARSSVLVGSAQRRSMTTITRAAAKSERAAVQAERAATAAEHMATAARRAPSVGAGPFRSAVTGAAEATQHAQELRRAANTARRTVQLDQEALALQRRVVAAEKIARRYQGVTGVVRRAWGRGFSEGKANIARREFMDTTEAFLEVTGRNQGAHLASLADDVVAAEEVYQKARRAQRAADPLIRATDWAFAPDRLGAPGEFIARNLQRMERRRAVRTIVLGAIDEAGLTGREAAAAQRALTRELANLETFARRLPSDINFRVLTDDALTHNDEAFRLLQESNPELAEGLNIRVRPDGSISHDREALLALQESHPELAAGLDIGMQPSGSVIHSQRALQTLRETNPELAEGFGGVVDELNNIIRNHGLTDEVGVVAARASAPASAQSVAAAISDDVADAIRGLPPDANPRISCPQGQSCRIDVDVAGLASEGTAERRAQDLSIAQGNGGLQELERAGGEPFVEGLRREIRAVEQRERNLEAAAESAEIARRGEDVMDAGRAREIGDPPVDRLLGEQVVPRSRPPLSAQTAWSDDVGEFAQSVQDDIRDSFGDPDRISVLRRMLDDERVVARFGDEEQEVLQALRNLADEGLDGRRSVQSLYGEQVGDISTISRRSTRPSQPMTRNLVSDGEFARIRARVREEMPSGTSPEQIDFEVESIVRRLEREGAPTEAALEARTAARAAPERPRDVIPDEAPPRVEPEPAPRVEPTPEPSPTPEPTPRAEPTPRPEPTPEPSPTPEAVVDDVVPPRAEPTPEVVPPREVPPPEAVDEIIPGVTPEAVPEELVSSQRGLTEAEENLVTTNARLGEIEIELAEVKRTLDEPTTLAEDLINAQRHRTELATEQAGLRHQRPLQESAVTEYREAVRRLEAGEAPRAPDVVPAAPPVRVEPEVVAPTPRTREQAVVDVREAHTRASVAETEARAARREHAGITSELETPTPENIEALQSSEILAREQLRQTEINLNQARLSLARAEAQAPADVVQEVRQVVRAEREAAPARRIAVAEGRVGDAQAELAAAERQLDEARAAVDEVIPDAPEHVLAMRQQARAEEQLAAASRTAERQQDELARLRREAGVVPEPSPTPSAATDDITAAQRRADDAQAELTSAQRQIDEAQAILDRESTIIFSDSPNFRQYQQARERFQNLRRELDLRTDEVLELRDEAARLTHTDELGAMSRLEDDVAEQLARDLDAIPSNQRVGTACHLSEPTCTGSAAELAQAALRRAQTADPSLSGINIENLDEFAIMMLRRAEIRARLPRASPSLEARVAAELSDDSTRIGRLARSDRADEARDIIREWQGRPPRRVDPKIPRAYRTDPNSPEIPASYQGAFDPPGRDIDSFTDLPADVRQGLRDAGIRRIHRIQSATDKTAPVRVNMRTVGTADSASGQLGLDRLIFAEMDDGRRVVLRLDSSQPRLHDPLHRAYADGGLVADVDHLADRQIASEVYEIIGARIEGSAVRRRAVSAQRIRLPNGETIIISPHIDGLVDLGKARRDFRRGIDRLAADFDIADDAIVDLRRAVSEPPRHQMEGRLRDAMARHDLPDGAVSRLEEAIDSDMELGLERFMAEHSITGDEAVAIRRAARQEDSLVAALGMSDSGLGIRRARDGQIEFIRFDEEYFGAGIELPLRGPDGRVTRRTYNMPHENTVRRMRAGQEPMDAKAAYRGGNNNIAGFTSADDIAEAGGIQAYMDDVQGPVDRAIRESLENPDAQVMLANGRRRSLRESLRDAVHPDGGIDGDEFADAFMDGIAGNAERGRMRRTIEGIAESDSGQLVVQRGRYVTPEEAAANDLLTTPAELEVGQIIDEGTRVSRPAAERATVPPPARTAPVEEVTVITRAPSRTPAETPTIRPPRAEPSAPLARTAENFESSLGARLEERLPSEVTINGQTVPIDDVRVTMRDQPFTSEDVFGDFVTHKAQEGRISLIVDGEEVGFAEFRYSPTFEGENTVYFHRTEVVEQFRGQGLGGSMSRAMEDTFREMGIDNIFLFAEEDGLLVWPRQGYQWLDGPHMLPGAENQRAYGRLTWNGDGRRSIPDDFAAWVGPEWRSAQGEDAQAFLARVGNRPSEYPDEFLTHLRDSATDLPRDQRVVPYTKELPVEPMPARVEPSAIEAPPPLTPEVEAMRVETATARADIRRASPEVRSRLGELADDAQGTVCTRLSPWRCTPQPGASPQAQQAARDAEQLLPQGDAPAQIDLSDAARLAQGEMRPYIPPSDDALAAARAADRSDLVHVSDSERIVEDGIELLEARRDVRPPHGPLPDARPVIDPTDVAPRNLRVARNPRERGPFGNSPSVGQAFEEVLQTPRITTDDVVSIINNPQDYVLNFRHGTSSAVLEGIGADGRLMSYGELRTSGRVPFSGELGPGIRPGDISWDYVSGVPFDQGGIDINTYARGMTSGWTPERGEQNLQTIASHLRQAQEARAQGVTRAGHMSIEDGIAMMQERMHIEQQRLDIWPTLDPFERQMISDPFPVVISAEVDEMTSLVGIMSERGRGFAPVGIDQERLVQGAIDLQETPFIVFVPRERIPQVQQYLETSMGRPVRVRSIESLEAFDSVTSRFSPSGSGQVAASNRLAFRNDPGWLAQFREEGVAYLRGEHPRPVREQMAADVSEALRIEQARAVREAELAGLTPEGVRDELVSSHDEIVRTEQRLAQVRADERAALEHARAANEAGESGVEIVGGQRRYAGAMLEWMNSQGIVRQTEQELAQARQTLGRVRERAVHVGIDADVEVALIPTRRRARIEDLENQLRRAQEKLEQTRDVVLRAPESGPIGIEQMRQRVPLDQMLTPEIRAFQDAEKQVRTLTRQLSAEQELVQVAEAQAIGLRVQRAARAAEPEEARGLLGRVREWFGGGCKIGSYECNPEVLPNVDVSDAAAIQYAIPELAHLDDPFDMDAVGSVIEDRITAAMGGAPQPTGSLNQLGDAFEAVEVSRIGPLPTRDPGPDASIAALLELNEPGASPLVGMSSAELNVRAREVGSRVTAMPEARRLEEVVGPPPIPGEARIPTLAPEDIVLIEEAVPLPIPRARQAPPPVPEETISIGSPQRISRQTTPSASCRPQEICAQLGQHLEVVQPDGSLVRYVSHNQYEQLVQEELARQRSEFFSRFRASEDRARRRVQDAGLRSVEDFLDSASIAHGEDALDTMEDAMRTRTHVRLPEEIIVEPLESATTPSGFPVIRARVRDVDGNEIIIERVVSSLEEREMFISGTLDLSPENQARISRALQSSPSYQRRVRLEGLRARQGLLGEEARVMDQIFDEDFSGFLRRYADLPVEQRRTDSQLRGLLQSMRRRSADVRNPTHRREVQELIDTIGSQLDAGEDLRVSPHVVGDHLVAIEPPRYGTSEPRLQVGRLEQAQRRSYQGDDFVFHFVDEGDLPTGRVIAIKARLNSGETGGFMFQRQFEELLDARMQQIARRAEPGSMTRTEHTMVSALQDTSRERVAEAMRRNVVEHEFQHFLTQRNPQLQRMQESMPPQEWRVFNEYMSMMAEIGEGDPVVGLWENYIRATTRWGQRDLTPHEIASQTIIGDFVRKLTGGRVDISQMTRHELSVLFDSPTSVTQFGELAQNPERMRELARSIFRERFGVDLNREGVVEGAIRRGDVSERLRVTQQARELEQELQAAEEAGLRVLPSQAEVPPPSPRRAPPATAEDIPMLTAEEIGLVDESVPPPIPRARQAPLPIPAEARQVAPPIPITPAQEAARQQRAPVLRAVRDTPAEARMQMAGEFEEIDNLEDVICTFTSPGKCTGGPPGVAERVEDIIQPFDSRQPLVVRADDLDELLRNAEDLRPSATPGAPAREAAEQTGSPLVRAVDEQRRADDVKFLEDALGPDDSGVFRIGERGEGSARVDELEQAFTRGSEDFAGSRIAVAERDVLNARLRLEQDQIAMDRARARTVGREREFREAELELERVRREYQQQLNTQEDSLAHYQAAARRAGIDPEETTRRVLADEYRNIARRRNSLGSRGADSALEEAKLEEMGAALHIRMQETGMAVESLHRESIQRVREVIRKFEEAGDAGNQGIIENLYRELALLERQRPQSIMPPAESSVSRIAGRGEGSVQLNPDRIAEIERELQENPGSLVRNMIIIERARLESGQDLQRAQRNFNRARVRRTFETEERMLRESQGNLIAKEEELAHHIEAGRRVGIDTETITRRAIVDEYREIVRERNALRTTGSERAVDESAIVQREQMLRRRMQEVGVDPEDIHRESIQNAQDQVRIHERVISEEQQAIRGVQAEIDEARRLGQPIEEAETTLILAERRVGVFDRDLERLRDELALLEGRSPVTSSPREPRPVPTGLTVSPQRAQRVHAPPDDCAPAVCQAFSNGYVEVTHPDGNIVRYVSQEQYDGLIRTEVARRQESFFMRPFSSEERVRRRFRDIRPAGEFLDNAGFAHGEDTLDTLEDILRSETRLNLPDNLVVEPLPSEVRPGSTTIRARLQDADGNVILIERTVTPHEGVQRSTSQTLNLRPEHEAQLTIALEQSPSYRRHVRLAGERARLHLIDEESRVMDEILGGDLPVLFERIQRTSVEKRKTDRVIRRQIRRMREHADGIRNPTQRERVNALTQDIENRIASGKEPHISPQIIGDHFISVVPPGGTYGYGTIQIRSGRLREARIRDYHGETFTFYFADEALPLSVLGLQTTELHTGRPISVMFNNEFEIGVDWLMIDYARRDHSDTPAVMRRLWGEIGQMDRTRMETIYLERLVEHEFQHYAQGERIARGVEDEVSSMMREIAFGSDPESQRVTLTYTLRRVQDSYGVAGTEASVHQEAAAQVIQGFFDRLPESQRFVIRDATPDEIIAFLNRDDVAESFARLTPEEITQTTQDIFYDRFGFELSGEGVTEEVIRQGDVSARLHVQNQIGVLERELEAPAPTAAGRAEPSPDASAAAALGTERSEIAGMVAAET